MTMGENIDGTRVSVRRQLLGEVIAPVDEQTVVGERQPIMWLGEGQTARQSSGQPPAGISVHMGPKQIVIQKAPAEIEPADIGTEYRFEDGDDPGLIEPQVGQVAGEEGRLVVGKPGWPAELWKQLKQASMSGLVPANGHIEKVSRFAG